MNSGPPATTPWLVLPFLTLLVSIFLGPWLWPRLWARYYPLLTGALGVGVLAYYLFSLEFGKVLHVAHDYLGFMALIVALFIVSGGIHINVKGEATPLANVVYLLVGAIAANLLGTTGASMLLIRPWLRMNRHRVAQHHVVFFIFIVANVGGCLTPIGDPPLFLGYLQGVPFWWIATHCWPMWAVTVGVLLVWFYILDLLSFRRAPAQLREQIAAGHESWRFEGLLNVAFLAVVLVAVFVRRPLFVREGLMLAAAVGSWFTTRESIHEANQFNFHPLQEVAILFFALFATMMPALDLVHSRAHELGQPSPGFFYWGCGLLSTVLDNAPTYLTFLSAARGIATPSATGVSPVASPDLDPLLAYPLFSQYLQAISVAAVFFGACTYIGNAPNFMVKSIAAHEKAPAPTFIGFVFKFSLPFLLPLLLLIWLVFLRNGPK